MVFIDKSITSFQTTISAVTRRISSYRRGNTHFSLAIGGCQRATDQSVGLYDWRALAIVFPVTPINLLPPLSAIRGKLIFPERLVVVSWMLTTL